MIYILAVQAQSEISTCPQLIAANRVIMHKDTICPQNQPKAHQNSRINQRPKHTVVSIDKIPGLVAEVIPNSKEDQSMLSPPQMQKEALMKLTLVCLRLEYSRR